MIKIIVEIEERFENMSFSTSFEGEDKATNTEVLATTMISEAIKKECERITEPRKNN